jgi:hypothetical protein
MEFCRDRNPGTARKPVDLSPLDVGDEMLWGEVGRLSRSKEGDARSSGTATATALP